MRSKLIPTDHIYIHKLEIFYLLMFLNPHMYLKSLLIVWATQLFGTRKRCLNISQFCIDYCKLMADSTFLYHTYLHSFIFRYVSQLPKCTLKVCLLYKLHNNAKIRRFWVVRQNVLRFWTLSTENTWHRKDSPLNQLLRKECRSSFVPIGRSFCRFVFSLSRNKRSGVCLRHSLVVRFILCDEVLLVRWAAQLFVRPLSAWQHKGRLALGRMQR